MKLRCAIFFLALAASVFAQCNGTASHYLPAVVEGDGVLVNVSLALEKGSGDVYFSIYPSIGMSTQQSAKEAVDYAFAEAGADRKSCDVRIKAYLPKTVGGYVDGPSGGAALALMGMAALEGKEIRGDAMITGTVSRYGTIGPVGGLYEKAKIARENGLEYFLTPVQTLYERVMLRILQQENGIEIFEVRDVGEAARFMLDRENLSTERKPPSVEEVNASIPYYGARQEFRPLAEEMMALLDRSAGKINPALGQEENLAPYFQQIKRNEQALFAKGYYFSAANDAFINYLDAETIASVDSLDVEGKVAETRQCLSGAQAVRMSDANFEWAAGQELRMGWAEKKLGEVEGENATLKEEKYAAYHEAMYADAWCRIVDMLGKNAPSGGNAFDEAALRNLSWEYVEAARRMNSSADDARWHLENAETLHAKGMYTGAIMDSVFAIEMENASRKSERDEEGALAELAQLSQERRASLWGDVYASHAAYVFWKGENDTAYGLFRFAKGLDRAAERMKQEIAKAEGKPAWAGWDLWVYGAVAAFLIAGAAAGAWLLFSAQQKPNVLKRKKRQ